MNTPLTKRQQQVLDFVRNRIERKNIPPTLEEIRKGLKLSAVSTVHQHINVLVDKGYLKKMDNFARAIELNQNIEQEMVQIPLLGVIAAGTPIETIEIPEVISVPKQLTLPFGQHFALRVEGQSMQDAGISTGDIVVIHQQSMVENGEIGVAVVNGEATLKRIFKEKNNFRLQPANSGYKPIFVRHLEIRGKLTGIMRSDSYTSSRPAAPTTLPYFVMSKKREQWLQIQSRRFLGNKSKLLGFIGDIVAEKCGVFQSFCDIFAGTGVVGYYFNRPEVKVIANDILASSYVSLQCWLGTNEYDRQKISNFVDYLNELKPVKENYVSRNFGGTFFTKNNALKIGVIRDEIENLDLSPREKYILLTSLLYAVDKAANTVGHFDAYRKNLDTIQELKLLAPDISPEKNSNNEIYNKDANELIRKIKCDVLYIDPPYNSRQYGDAYHLLENVVTWNKPEVEGVAKKMKQREHLKSKYCLKSAPEAFRDLIANARVKHILLSYNNTGETKNKRSNARITDQQIISTLKAKGEVEIFERDYKGFTTGKSKAEGNSERIFYCKVTK